MVKQGDIIKINLNPKQGHEQKGYRPYICLTNKKIIEYSNIAIFAPISNTEREYPFYIEIPTEKYNELETTGKVLLDQLVAIDFNSRDYKYIETCPDEFIEELLIKTKVIFQKD